MENCRQILHSTSDVDCGRFPEEEISSEASPLKKKKIGFCHFYWAEQTIWER